MSAAPLLLAGASLVLLALGAKRMVPPTAGGHRGTARPPGRVARSRAGRRLAASGNPLPMDMFEHVQMVA